MKCLLLRLLIVWSGRMKITVETEQPQDYDDFMKQLRKNEKKIKVFGLEWSVQEVHMEPPFHIRVILNNNEVDWKDE